jgi:magnesium chelatase family protein
MTFPAEFMLVAGDESVSCGYFGDSRRDCRCTPAQVERYRQRISGPLLDRIDIHLEVPAVEYRDMAGNEPPNRPPRFVSECKARLVQQNRFAGKGKVRCNARMSSRMIKSFCGLDDEAEGLMRMAMTELNFSAALTIAFSKSRAPSPTSTAPKTSPHDTLPRRSNTARSIAICGRNFVRAAP